MAKRKKAVPKVKKRDKLNTKWLNNAMRSIGAATADTFKDIMPTTFSTASSAAQMVKDVRESTRGTSIGKINNMVAGNKYVKMAKKALDQSIDDIKSGNLYNDGRALDAMSSDFEDEMTSFFDEYEDDGEGVTFNYIDESGDDGNQSVVFAEAINRSAEMNLKASKATVDAMISLTSTSLTQQTKLIERIDENITNVNSTLSSILQYHEENTTRFYETAIAAFEKIGQNVADDDRGSKNDEMDIFNDRGGIDLNRYKSYLKTRIKKVVNDSPAGMVLPFLTDDSMLEMLIADPVGGITKGVIGGLIPSVISGTLDQLDKTFSTLLPNMLTKLARSAEPYNASFFQKTLGNIFGISAPTKRNSINMEDRFERGAAVFDDVTRNAIVEILPKYARESTAYLKEIARAVTHKKSDKILDSSQVFDYQTSTYKDLSKVNEDTAKALENTIVEAFKSVDFGKILSSAASDLDDKSKERYDRAVSQLLVQLSNNKTLNVADFNLDDKDSIINQALQGVEGKGKQRNSKKLLTEAIRYMYDNDIGLDSALLGNIKARSAYSNKIDELGRNPEMFNLIASGVSNETDMNEFLDRYTGNKAALLIRAKENAKRKRDDERDNRDKVKDNLLHPKGAKRRAGENISSYVEYQKELENRDKSYGSISDNFVGDLGRSFATAGGHLKDSMWAMMKGDSKGMLDSFNQVFTSLGKSAWESTKKTFIDPLATRIFGEKDEKGNSKDGFLSGLRNKTNDTWKALVQRINGKDFEDSNGEKHTLKDPDDSLVGKASKIFQDVGEGIRYRLFGEKKKGKEGDEETDEEGKKTGVIGNLITSMKLGIQGWKNALFGDDEKDPDHKAEIKKIKDGVMEALPDALLGTGIGALTGGAMGGSLLGTLIGGPVGGAIIGLAGGLLSRSDKFKDWLFGPEVEDENGKRRIGGFISEKTQTFLKDHKKTIIGGAALGAMKSILFPKSVGLLTSAVGGPIAGAAVGIGFGLLKESDAWQKFLYGDEEKGRRGVVQAFKDIFKGGKPAGSEKDNKDNTELLKSLGMGAVGAVGGGLSAALIGKVGLLGAMVTPLGPIGGAIIGAATGILAKSKKFTNWFFGEKDEETGKRKGGILGKFTNYMQVEIFQPMKSKALDIVDDIKTTVKYDILENIRIPFLAVADNFKEKLDAAFDKVKAVGKDVVNLVDETIIKPFGTIVDTAIVQPVKKVVSKATDFIYTGTKAIVTAPFRLVGRLFKWVTGKKGPVRKALRGLLGFTKKLLVGIFKPIGAVAKGIFNVGATVVGGTVGVVKGIGRRVVDKYEEKHQDQVDNLRSKYNDWKARREDNPLRKEYFGVRADRAREYQENKNKKKERKQLDQNRRMMAKALGYDEKYFTEETMQKAELEAAKKGIKIRWKGTDETRTFDQTPEQKRAELLKSGDAKIVKEAKNSPDINVHQLSEQIKSNQTLNEIKDLLQKTYKELIDAGFTPEEAQSEIDTMQDEIIGDAELAYGDTKKKKKEEKQRKKEEKKKKKKSKGNQEEDNDLDEAAKQKMEEESEEEESEEEEPKEEKKRNWGDDVVEKGRNVAGTVENTIREYGLRNTLRGTIRGIGGSIRDIFKDNGKARAEGGPVEEGDAYLVGDGGKDPNAEEIFVPEKSGEIIPQKKNDGIKVRLIGIANDAIHQLVSLITSGIGKAVPFLNRGKKQEETTEDVVLQTDSGVDVVSVKPELAAKVKAAQAAAENKKKSDAQKEKDAAEISAQEEKGDYASQIEYQLKQNETIRAERQTKSIESISEHLKSMLGISTSQRKDWLSIFKKGLVGIALIKLLPWLLTNLPKIKDAISSVLSAVSGIAGNMGSQAEWTSENSARDNGDTAAERIDANLSNVGEVASDLAHGDLIDAAGDFVLDDGTYDAQSGGKASLLTHGAVAGVKNASKIAKKAKKIGSGVYKVGKAVGGTAYNAAKSGITFAKDVGSDVYNLTSSSVSAKLARGELTDSTQLLADLTEENTKTGKVGELLGKAKNGVGKVTSKAKNAVSNITSKFGKNATEAAASTADDFIGFGLEEADDVAKAATESTGGKAAVESVGSVAKKKAASLLSKVLETMSNFFDTIATKAATKCNTAKGPITKALTKILERVNKAISSKFSTISAKVSEIAAGRTTLDAVTLGSDKVVFCTIGFINGGGKGATARLFGVDKSDVDWKMRAISAAFGAFTVGTTTGAIVDVVCGLISDVLGIDLLNTVATTIYKAISSDEDDEKLDTAQSEWKNAYLEYQNAEIEKNYETQKKLGNVSEDISLEDYKQGVKDGTYSATYKGYDDWNADQNTSIGSKLGKVGSTAVSKVKSLIKGNTSYTDDQGRVYKDIGDNQYMVYDADGNEIGAVAKSSIDTSNMEKSTKGGIVNGVKSIGKGIAGAATTAAGAVKENAIDPLVSGVKGAVSTIGSGLSDLGSLLKEATDAISKGQGMIKDNFDNPDMDFSAYATANVNTLSEDHPFYQPVNGFLTSSKILGFIYFATVGSLKRVTKAIAKGVSSIFNTTVATFKDVGKQYETIDIITQNGDIGALNSFKYEPADDLFGGFAKALVGIHRAIAYPITGINVVGKKIGTFFKNTVDKGFATFKDIAKETAKLDEIATSGDLEAMNSFKYEPDDGLFGGLAKAIVGIHRTVCYPITGVHVVGNKIGSFVSAGIDKVKGVIDGAKDSVADLNDFMKDGNITSIFSYKPKIDENTPASGFVKGILGVAKYAFIPSAFMHKVANSVGDFISSAVDEAKDITSTIKDYITDLTAYTDPDKDISGFDKVKVKSSDPVSQIMGFVIKRPVRWYVNFMRVFKSIGNWFTDKLDSLTTTASNVKSSISGVFDSIGDGVGSILNSIMTFARGGSGKGRRIGGKGSDTVNGYSYYSQDDPSWGSKSYVSSNANDGATLADTGCGPTAMSMVISQANKNVDPTQMAKLAANGGYRDETGTNADFIDYAGDSYGLSHNDVANPDSSYIQDQVNSGKSVVLNGVSDNDTGKPFTKAGHYVVAVGTDENGNILVNDPRGKSYSKAYSPDELANDSQLAWSFDTGGNGTRKRRVRRSGGFGKIRRVANKIRRKMGGRGVSGDWLSIVKSVKSLVAAKKPEYNQKGSMTIEYGGKTWKLRTDCSGLVGVMLRIYGAISEGANVTSSSLCSSSAIADGFTFGKWTGWDNLKEGDIITRHGHVEVFCKNENGVHYVYNGGSTDALCSPGATETGHKSGYEYVWRPGDAGTGGDAITDTSSSSSDDGTLSGTLSNVTNVVSQYADAAITGAYTGNYDDSKIVWGSSSDTGSDSSSDSSTSSAYTAATGSTVKNQIWNFFRAKGLSDAAIAGIMGNMQAESGFNPKNLQNSYEKKLGYTDDTYTEAVDDGSYSKFATDGAGYGLVQFTFNTLKKGLLDYAKANNLSVGSADSQLNFIYNSTEGKNAIKKIANSTSPRDAAKSWMLNYERPDDQSSTAQTTRAGYAQSIYNSRPASKDITNGGKGTGTKSTAKTTTNYTALTTEDLLNYGVGSSNAGTTTTTTTTPDGKVIELMNTMITVLKEIGVNTSKIEDLSSGLSSISSGGNNIIVNGGNGSSTQTNSIANTSTSDSRNAILAAKIAKG